MAGRAGPRSARIFLNFLGGKYPGVTMRQFQYCRIHGFYPERALEFDFTNYRPEDYFPDSSAGALRKKLDPSEVVCCLDKVVFALYMRAIGGNTPPVVAENSGGRLILYVDDAKDFESLLCMHGELVVKPRESVGGGGGIRMVRPGSPDPAPRPGEFATPRVQQHAYAAAIYPHSANTIRILTAWDYDRKDIFVAAAAHRFGSSLADGVDNWGAGGLGVGIDLASGQMGPGIREPRFDRSRTRHETHPDTGTQIDGEIIPRFAETCAGLLCVARRFPRRYVGWDIVITPDSWTIIEANSVPDLSLFQFHRPVLLDPRLRAYYTREGVI